MVVLDHLYTDSGTMLNYHREGCNQNSGLQIRFPSLITEHSVSTSKNGPKQVACCFIESGK
jgi:hypothetical protein